MRTLIVSFTAILCIALPSSALAELSLEGGLAYDAAPKGDRGSMKFLGPTQLVYVSGVIKNSGNARATSIMVELIIGTRIIGRALIGDLKAGATAPFSVKWTPESADTLPVMLKIDPSNSVREDDESNNKVTSEIVIAYNVPTAEMTGDNIPRPELLITSPSINPGPIVSRLSSITCDIENTGAAVAENIEVAIMIGGARFATKTIGPIAPESTKSVLFSWMPAHRGPVTVQMLVDPENKIMESDETNNSAEKSVEVKR